MKIAAEDTAMLSREEVEAVADALVICEALGGLIRALSLLDEPQDRIPEWKRMRDQYEDLYEGASHTLTAA